MQSQSIRTLTQAQNLRDCVGKDRTGSPFDRLLPVIGNPDPVDRDYRLFYQLPSGSLLSEKFKGRSIRSQIWEREERKFSAFQQEGIRRILVRDIGLSIKMATVLVSRPVNQFKRIEEFISGLVDSLWLTEETIFLHNHERKVYGPQRFYERDLIKHLVRKIYKVGAFAPVTLVDDWKEWTNWLFHTVAKTQTIGALSAPKRNNIFRCLQQLGFVRRLLSGEINQLLLQHLSHLVSSRQMPYMGFKTEKRALEEYKYVLTTDFKPSHETEYLLRASARRVGAICRKLRGSLNPGESHISVTSSGEYGSTISDGGQAAAVVDAMRRILLEVPLEDRTEDTPFGPAVHMRGIPLWKTVFRTIPLVPEVEFLQAYTFIKEQPGRFRGLDEATGIQIMYVAWRELSNTIILRAETVPEMGNKARIVTLSEYWLNVLQAPLSHLLIDAMKYHPCVFSSFHRQDQAWEAVKGLCSSKQLSLEEGHAVLSSDLKDATNAQQWSITKAMLHGFIDGFGLSFRRDYIELVLGLIGPRLIFFKDGTTVQSSTGIMMGEAIAKPSLTLLNLSIEELAFLQHVSTEDSKLSFTRMLTSEEPSPYRRWRFYHIGGDDHLARGPIPYLNLITRNHELAGSHISPGKHGFSRLCVKYTERLINLSNLQYGKPFHPEYPKSTIVDSVKVRLLERGQSTMLKKDNKNVAIGKSQQLGGCLEWLPKDDRYFTETKKSSIRALFVERMGSLLPRKAVNPRAFAAIHLPTKVGGYGLGLSWELQSWFQQCPEPSKGLIYKAHLGLDVKDDLRRFRILNTNTSTRGVESILDFQEKIIGQLSEYPQMINAISWKELKALYPDDNARRTIALAADNGILSIEEFAKRATRGNLFQELLLGKKDLKVFNTRPYVQTYKNVVWPYAEDSGLVDYGRLAEPLTSDQIAIAIDGMVPQWYFDINQTTAIDTGFWDPEFPETETWEFGEATYINKYTEGMPSLAIPTWRLGIKVDRPEIRRATGVRYNDLYGWQEIAR